MPPLLVFAEFGCTEEGDAEFRRHLDRTLREVRAVEGCEEAVVWERPSRRYLFGSVWSDRDAVRRWVANEFHRSVLMPGFRAWGNEGWFSYWDLTEDHNRARKCPACGRWTQAQPGWSEFVPRVCSRCGAALG